MFVQGCRIWHPFYIVIKNFIFIFCILSLIVKDPSFITSDTVFIRICIVFTLVSYIFYIVLLQIYVHVC